MDSCSLNSKLQFSLIFSFIYEVWGAKIRFVSKKIMGKNIGPRKGSGGAGETFRKPLWPRLPPRRALEASRGPSLGPS